MGMSMAGTKLAKNRVGTSDRRLETKTLQVKPARSLQISAKWQSP